MTTDPGPPTYYVQVIWSGRVVTVPCWARSAEEVARAVVPAIRTDGRNKGQAVMLLKIRKGNGWQA